MAGVCCAISAARMGVRVVLVHDRPVLGGNASSEVRLWILGATSHMGNNNRWAREGGVIDEILVENLYRNPEGNPLHFDILLLEKVAEEKNITLLLNTSVHALDKDGPDRIKAVHAYCSQNQTAYEISAPFFCDSSGDGIVGFMSGAAFRMGTEGREEFDELSAPMEPTSDLLGHTIYFYSKDAGRPVNYVPPSFALRDITKIPRWRHIKGGDHGLSFWWIEWGGILNTISETEAIKWELWRVVYGLWNHIKNSGQFPEAETLTLEWVGTIPGKRESRRFEGDYMISQRDIIEQRNHRDAVAFGGWAIDLHPPEGVYSPQPPCTQWHSKGVYQIPFRCLYSRNIQNLYFAGRNISATHVAFGSTRVMATCATLGQVVAAAVAQGCPPARVDIKRLQRDLFRAGHFIPGIVPEDEEDLARAAIISASSTFKLRQFDPNGRVAKLLQSRAMMLPVPRGALPAISVWLDVAKPTVLRTELRISSNPSNHTPDVTLHVLEIPLAAGKRQPVTLDFGAMIDSPRYAFVCLMANEDIEVHLSDIRVTGILSAIHGANKAVAKAATQTPPPGSGIDTFEFWLPQRRPGGENFALKLQPPLEVYYPGNVANGIARPTRQPNAWVAELEDPTPTLCLEWPHPQEIGSIELRFDSDWDHPLESVFMPHPERVIPFCVQEYSICDREGRVLAQCTDNHQTRNIIRLAQPCKTSQIRIRCSHPSATVPAALFEVRCYHEGWPEQ